MNFLHREIQRRFFAVLSHERRSVDKIFEIAVALFSPVSKVTYTLNAESENAVNLPTHFRLVRSAVNYSVVSVKSLGLTDETERQIALFNFFGGDLQSLQMFAPYKVSRFGFEPHRIRIVHKIGHTRCVEIVLDILMVGNGLVVYARAVVIFEEQTSVSRIKRQNIILNKHFGCDFSRRPYDLRKRFYLKPSRLVDKHKSVKRGVRFIIFDTITDEIFQLFGSCKPFTVSYKPASHFGTIENSLVVNDYSVDSRLVSGVHILFCLTGFPRFAVIRIVTFEHQSVQSAFEIISVLLFRSEIFVLRENARSRKIRSVRSRRIAV